MPADIKKGRFISDVDIKKKADGTRAADNSSLRIKAALPGLKDLSRGHDPDMAAGLYPGYGTEDFAALVRELESKGSINKLSSTLDKIASALESKGRIKEAEEIDVISNTLEALDGPQDRCSADKVPGDSSEHTKLQDIKKVLGIPDNFKKMDSEILDTMDKLVNKATYEMSDKSYTKKETVNGIVISVGWSSNVSNREYTIIFPGAANKAGIDDVEIGVSRDRNQAELAFNQAKKIAQTDSDVISVYKKVKDFVYKMKSSTKNV